MVKLGIVSDSHHSRFWLERYVELAGHSNYDVVFHLGDVSADAAWLGRKLGVPLINVVGNCDFFADGDAERISTYEGHHILVTHGHLQDVKWGLDALSYHAEERGADIALFGHTHRALACYVGSVLLINPGALMEGEYGELIIDRAHINPYLKSLRD